MLGSMRSAHRKYSGGVCTCHHREEGWVLSGLDSIEQDLWYPRYVRKAIIPERREWREPR